MSRWRNDGLNPKDEPTVFSVVPVAEDVIRRDEDFTLRIVHVRMMRGPGFMAAVRSTLGGSMHNGDAFPGDGAEAYARALKQGEEIFKEETERLAKMLEAHGLVRPKPEG